MRFSCIFRRMAGLVCSSLMRTPYSSWSSVPETWMQPARPGRARGETPDGVSAYRL
jgi:hypothetical protein